MTKDIDEKVKKTEYTKTEFKPTRYPRPWQVELTDEQRENMRKRIEEDTKRYRELGKKIAEDKSHQALCEKISKDIKNDRSGNKK